MIGCFNHEVEHRVTRSYHTVALKLAPRINASYKRLMVRLLLITELGEEET